MTLEELQKQKSGAELYGLIGHPLGHSLSPEIHARLMRGSGTVGSYTLIEIPPGELKAAIPVLRDKTAGFNVTIPHKERIIPLLDGLDESAERYGAVNTVRNDNGRLTGFNTDAAGFRSAIRQGDIALNGRVLVLGAGGVARMMAAEAVGCGAEVEILARSHEKAEAVASFIRGSISGARVKAIKTPEGEYDLLLNGTPVGMYPKVNAMPVDNGTLERCKAVFDTIYNPYRTKLVLRAMQCGKKAEGGLSMLAGQAAEAQRIWNGKDTEYSTIQTITEEMQKILWERFPLCIVLYGFMGSGKSTAGKLLATKLGWKFVDLDREIEAMAGMTIPKIFDKYGESRFREMEGGYFAIAVHKKKTVLATGGGTLASLSNIGNLEGTPSIAVFLKATMPEILKRVGDGHGRPMLKMDAKTKASLLYETRLPNYMKAADITVDADRGTDAVIENIMESLGWRNRK